MKPLVLLLGLVLLFGPTAALSADPSPRMKELQEALVEFGYDPGPPDGLMGPKTREAIIAFQKDHDLAVDGKYSGLLLFKVNTELEIRRQEATPEGQKKKQDRRRLLAMSNDELVTLIDRANKKEAERIFNLLGKRALELPMRLLFSITAATPEFSNVIVSMILKGLFYPNAPDGTKQFQADIVATETGELTFGQFEELQRRWTRSRDTPVYASGFGKIKITGFDGWVSVKGTWILEGEQIAYPINTAEITCERDRRECRLIQADLVVPNLDDSGDSYMLSVNSDSYSIISWEPDEIVARDSGECRITLLTLNLNSNEVYEVTRNNESQKCLQAYLSLPKLDKPRVARLVPGWKTTYEFWQKRREIVSKYNNPRVIQEMESVFKELK